MSDQLNKIGILLSEMKAALEKSGDADKQPDPTEEYARAKKFRELDLHNSLAAETCKFDHNGQWNIQKSNYGPKGAGLYNPTDNINRKANRTGDEVESAGRNTAVHQWTTNSSANGKAHTANMQREQAIANKKMPVRTTISPEEKAKIEAAANIKKNGDGSKPDAYSDTLDYMKGNDDWKSSRNHIGAAADTIKDFRSEDQQQKDRNEKYKTRA